MDVTLSSTSPSPRPAVPAEPRIEALVEALRDPACYPHPVERVEVHETHISYVLLAGEFAYKLKKPVRLPFLDFSSPIARRHYCQEELRLNRRTAPQLYLSVECIGGDIDAPRVGECHLPLEYAVKMRRFPQEALMSRMASDGRLEAAHVDALADAIADFHASIAGERPPRDVGSAESTAAPALENFRDIQALGMPGPSRAKLEPLHRWTHHEHQALTGRFALRRHDGYVRECHGDLHLGNVVMLEGRPVLFDGIEFGARYRWIDVMSDVAFAFMDLARHGLHRHAWRLLDRYLARTGDYGALALLRFYAVYRALVRAKVACIRSRQPGLVHQRRIAATGEFQAYLDLAAALSRRPAPALVLMHGVSGSGKTTVSQRLLESLGAVRLRSDVERKRLHGLRAAARTGAAPGEGIYGAAENDRTYARLAELAREALAAGYPAIVDATFLERARRDDFRRMAESMGARFAIASCAAPQGILHQRLAGRERVAADASEAGAAVLDMQLARAEALGEDERARATHFDTASAVQWEAGAESLAERLRAGGGA